MGSLNIIRPGGGVAGVAETAWETVDLDDGSWSAATDPDGIISTAATASGITTFTYNAISSGSQDYAFNANTTNLKGWRVNKALTFNGSALVGGDIFAVLFEIDCTSGYSSDGATQIFLGLSTDPTSTVRQTADCFGMAEEHTAGDVAPNFLAVAITAGGTALTNSNNVLGRGIVMANTNRISDVTVTALGTSTTYGTSARNPALEIADDDDIYIVVGAGTRGSATISASDTAVAKLRYAVVKLGS